MPKTTVPGTKTFRSFTLSLSGSHRDLNKEILSRIGFGASEKRHWQASHDTPSSDNLNDSQGDAGVGILLEEEHTVWTLLKSMFTHTSTVIRQHWGFNKLQVVAELRATPEDYLCSVRHTFTGHMAIVRILHRKIARPHRKLFEMEKRCWHRVSFCSQVLTCRVYYRTKQFDVFICEYFYGCLLSELLAEGVIQPKIAMKIISQVAFAICSIHNVGMIFRGVAPQNILVDADGNIRLFDFQFATDKEWSFYPTGFLPYMAPEMIEGKRSYGPEVDYWALGILMYELTVRHSPLSVFCRLVGLEDIRDPEYTMLLLDHMPIRLPGNIDPNARALMRELLHDNPRLRIGCRRRGFEELKNHPYFDGVLWETYQIVVNRVKTKPRKGYDRRQNGKIRSKSASVTKNTTGSFGSDKNQSKGSHHSR